MTVSELAEPESGKEVDSTDGMAVTACGSEDGVVSMTGSIVKTLSGEAGTKCRGSSQFSGSRPGANAP